MRVRDLVESGSVIATIRIDSPMLHPISVGVRDLQFAGLFHDAALVDPDGHRIEAAINRPQA